MFVENVRVALESFRWQSAVQSPRFWLVVVALVLAMIWALKRKR